MDIEFWRQREEGPGHPDMGFEKADPYYRKTVGKLIKKGARVLDAGCGYGRFSGWFRDYAGIDFVPEFIEKAKELHPSKTFLVADMNGPLPFKDKEFDWCLMVSSRQYVDDMSELKRVSKNILILSYGEPHEYIHIQNT